ncbi:helix-turn-helix domain-containing protein [Paenibacillus flagellatus]|uniref:HTH araC/xylS-type domain-containing protein n=1 Tax=Paenibacillus flagellatus TaxID=2211139 RepID=A0A2V5KGE7_9BACL|nr:helix-turn-helix domain-containing protein [Paenibacillus flagellatus]PYI57403.1 hypothetical protein DLM86_02900 [Paenibacillus flagellatus]
MQFRYNAMTLIPPNTYPQQEELLVARPVPMFYEGKPDGMIITQLDREKVAEMFDQAKLGENRKLLVLDQRGTIVMSERDQEIGGTITTTSELYSFWQSPESFDSPLVLGGVPYHLSLQRSALTGWTYIAMTPMEQLNGKSDHIRSMTWGIVAIVIAVWMVVALIGSNRLYTPIRRITSKLSADSLPSPDDGLAAIDSYIDNMARTNNTLKLQIDQLSPRFKESVCLALLRGETGDLDLPLAAKQAGLPGAGQTFYVCIADIDEYASFQSLYGDRDRSLLRYALRKLIEELFAGLGAMTVVPSPGQVATIIGFDRSNGDGLEALQEIGAQVIEKVRAYFAFTVTVAVSGPHAGYAGIHDAYREANGLLGYRLLLGHSQWIDPGSIAPDLTVSRSATLRHIKSIVESLSAGDLEEARARLSELKHIVPQQVPNSETVLGQFAFLLGELEFLMQSLGKDTSSLFEKDPYRQLYGMTSLDEIADWFSAVIFPIVVGNLQSPDRQTAIVHQALVYIRDHVESDLSLQRVAEPFGLSASHFSKVFKEVTGHNFVDYVIEYRMKVAMEWLAHTDIPIKEMAERLRYTNVQNFSRTFKQVTGMPPGQYRSKFGFHDESPV